MNEKQEQTCRNSVDWILTTEAVPDKSEVVLKKAGRG